ncbi:MAG TPA: lipoyl synthase, partial [Verrucomicrobiae bacterium]
KFDEYGERARAMGFVHVASGPMVRSSYHAHEFSARPVRADPFP